MPNITASHVASLPVPVATPSLAIRQSDGAGVVLGSGINLFAPGSPVETIFDADENVPEQAAVTLRGNVLTVYGGKSDFGALSVIQRYDIDRREKLTSLGDLPLGLRLSVAVKHGEKDVLLGGVNEHGSPIRSVIVSKGGRDGRVLETMLPGSAYGLQVGRIGHQAFVLGSGSQDWKPPFVGYDFLLRRDDAADASTSIPMTALRDGKAEIGVCVIQKGNEEFYSFGGADGNLGVSADLWHHTSAGSVLLGSVVDADGNPYRVCRCVGLYASIDNSIYLIGGLVGSPYSSLSKGTDRIVRLDLGTL